MIFGRLFAVLLVLSAAALPAEQRLAARRRGPAVICHRGASTLALENTLDAYRAALEYGADGCEIDIRRTSDGVLVLFHDDMTDRLTTGFGTIERRTWGEVSRLRFRDAPSERIPTLRQLLQLAVRRDMLLHLDVKQSGLDAAIAAELEAAGAWGHVVAVNRDTAPQLAGDPRIRPLRYKGPGLYEGRKDMDPDAVRAQLGLPGEMVMVDDPRVAARLLGRPGHRRLTGWSPARPERSSVDPLHLDPIHPLDHARSLASRPAPSPREVTRLLATEESLEDRVPNPDHAREVIRARRTLQRAWAADQAGRQRLRTTDVVRRLEFQVRHRSMHRDWMYHGLDGACAARALGEIGSSRSAPDLVEAFRRIDPALTTIRDPRFAANPLAWTDFRMKMTLIPALGRLRHPSARAFLAEYVAMPPERARELSPLLYEEAARALLRHDLARPEIEALLRSSNSAVRGAALLVCLDEPTPRRGAALRSAVPWAWNLPRLRERRR